MFSASFPDPGPARMDFSLKNFKGDIWFKNIELRPGYQTTLNKGESLEQGTIELPETGVNSRRDYFEFLMDTEERYSQTMRDYIKNELHVRAPITCSQATYGNIAGLWRERKSDFLDVHSYWQHPHFPAGEQ